MDALSPTQMAVKDATRPVAVKDVRGRSITIQRIGIVDRMRFFELVGAENIKNEMYVGYAMLAYHVAEIDGEPVPRPATKAQLEALVQRLDDDGMNAVATGVADNFTPAATQAEAKDAVKNG